MSTGKITRTDIEGVATQDSSGDVGCELLDSATPILAKRSGDTLHLGGNSIPAHTHAFEYIDIPTMALRPYRPVVSHSQMT